MKPALVTGADQHQGLAVIRGLGKAGIPVVATSHVSRCLGFKSRYPFAKEIYRAPDVDEEGFINDVMEAVERHQVGVIVPVIESTLAVLDRYRDRIPDYCQLAAPSAETLTFALDKLKTMALAERVGVPVPRTAHEDDFDTLFDKAKQLTFPVAIKPRGNAMHGDTSHRMNFKVHYCETADDLEKELQSLAGKGVPPLVQEYTTGHGICVANVFDHGKPLCIFPYVRLREVPLTGGVSVVRKSIPLEPRLRDYVCALLGELDWHGVAMVEFKYNPVTDCFVLMEINGRFQASSALSLDSGANLPELVYLLYMDLPIPPDSDSYTVGITERWLRGDMYALFRHLNGNTEANALPAARKALPSKTKSLLRFLGDFRPGVKLDEFKFYDPGPSLIEIGGLIRVLASFSIEALKNLVRKVIRKN